MNIEKLRKKHVMFHRKQRRKLYLKAYKELKNEIKKESNRGKLFVSFKGRFNYEYAVAARLFYRKNKSFYVKTLIENTIWDEFKVTKIFISWSKDKEPILEEIIIFNTEDEEEED